jgi:hypothetical protein
LPVGHYLSNIWRENAAKSLIAKDRVGGVSDTKWLMIHNQ